jgi:multidrug resistance efflux pump
MMDIEDIELRSDPVKEVLSRPPQWLVRWGITVIAGIAAMLVGLAFLIQYPDTLAAEITITTTQPPASVKAMSSGRLGTLLVQEGQAVAEGELLAVIDNAADFGHLQAVDTGFAPFHRLLIQHDSAGRLALAKERSLGMVQPAYTAFFKAHQDYWHFMDTHLYRERLEQVRQKIIAQRRLSQGLSEQQAILATDFALTRRQLQTDSTLLRKGVIAQRDWEASEKAFLQEQYRVKSFEVELVNADIRIQELEAQAVELRQAFRQERQTHLEALKQASLQLEAQLAAWRQLYALRAPLSGRVAFFKLWGSKQFVSQGDEVMVVLPKAEELFGYMAVKQQGFGKVKVGQQVNIRFSGFPHEEFGMARGRVAAISSIPRDGAYMVRVTLPQGLLTNYGKTLPFSQEMQGEGRIITEDLRLIQRIFYHLRALWQQEGGGA